MLPYNNSPHLIADLAQEHYKDLRRDADAWRLAHVGQKNAETRYIPAETGLRTVLMKLRLRLAGTPRAQIAVCP